MPEIIHIEFKRRRPERFIVHWDSGEEQIFSPETAAKYGFAPGESFSDEEYRQILREDGIRRAKDQALKYLAIRPHSRKELLLKILRKGYLPELIEPALNDLQKVDLINDEKFSRQFIHDELLLRPCGKNLLREKLLARGVPPAIFQPILEEFFQQQPQEEVARQIAEKFLARHRHVPLPKRREKLIRHLQGKGFDWEMVNRVLLETKLIDSVEE